MKKRVAISLIIITHALVASTPEQISNNILNILKTYQITKDIDKEGIYKSSKIPKIEQPSYEDLQKKIIAFAKENKPLKFLLVGFPFKSANTEKKVLGSLPDMAERRSLEYLYRCIKSLSAVYPYGVELVIFCDGIPFAEYLGIPEKIVKAYERVLQKLALDMPEIKIITSSVLQGQLKLYSVEKLCSIIDNFSPTNKEFYIQLESDTTLQDGYKTLISRLEIEFDSKAGREFIAKNGPLSKIAKSLMAREMRLRRFIEEHFDPDSYIRLTVHYSKDLAKKFGIKLSPDSCITPYHGVLVEDKDGWHILLRQDIDPQFFEEVSQVVNGVQCRYMRRKY